MKKSLSFVSMICIALCGVIFCACRQKTELPQESTVAQSDIGAEGKEAEKPVHATEETVTIPDLSDVSNVDEILALLIEDEGFRERVRYGIDVEEGDSPETVLYKLENCESLLLKKAPHGKTIDSLESLALFPNLKELVVDINEWDDSAMEDFTPIEQLSKLERIYISYGKEEEIDLSFLGGMRSITELYLTHCRLEDSSFLEKMPQLQRLSLYETPVEDLAFLEKLPELVELSLYGNENARHIEAVGTLTKMQDLGMQYCGIEDIGFLSGLTDLRGINLNGNSVKDITPLAGLKKLERLGLSENGISDISVLADLENLFDLALDGNEIQDISPLAGLMHLNQAGLSNNRIEDLTPLEGKEELMYAAVFGNPVKSIQPVWDVPMLWFTEKGVSDEEEAFITEWLRDHEPDVQEFTCIDFIEGDLNKDGRQDLAFVVDSEAFDVCEEDFPERMPDDRRFFILLQQKDGSWKELEDVPSLPGSGSGGLRGDPYRGAFLEAGFLVIKTGWGSSSGSVETEIYAYRDGNLQLEECLNVGDYNYAEGYDVQIKNMQNDTWERYAIASDGYRMVRVDLADFANPEHKAFPETSLFERSYIIYRDKIESQMMPSEALDCVCESLEQAAVQEKLPYADWQKEGYELIVGVTLPDYYYVFPETTREADGEANEWEGDYLYYDGVTEKDGTLSHVIIWEKYGEERILLLDDSTGEVTDGGV